MTPPTSARAKKQIKEARDVGRLAAENAMLKHALADIAEGVPTADQWRSAADFMEGTAATLDRYGIERPARYQHG